MRGPRTTIAVPRLLLAAILIVIPYILLKSVRPPVPSSVLHMYMLFIVIGVLLYMTFDDGSKEDLLDPLRRLFGDPDLKALRAVVFIILPLACGYLAYTRMRPAIEPPVELRIAHPPPPPVISAFGKRYNLLGLANPMREDKKNLDRYVAEGGEIYFRNCFYCHGAKLDGRGPYADGLNPPPIGFSEVGTIGELNESYLFWRITSGGAGLPRESSPWSSAMPAWKDHLSEEEIWKVILFLYDYTGFSPRTTAEREEEY